MSDTPRTDAVMCPGDKPCPYLIGLKHARTLERELAAAQRENAELRAELSIALQSASMLRSDVSELRGRLSEEKRLSESAVSFANTLEPKLKLELARAEAAEKALTVLRILCEEQRKEITAQGGESWIEIQKTCSVQHGKLSDIRRTLWPDPLEPHVPVCKEAKEIEARTKALAEAQPLNP